MLQYVITGNFTHTCFDQLCFNGGLNTSHGICLEVSLAVINRRHVHIDMFYLLTFFLGGGLVIFAVDCIVCRTVVSQLFTCVLLTVVWTVAV